MCLPCINMAGIGMAIIDISRLAATERLAQALAAQSAWLTGKVVYLDGDLGVGKTTLVRYLLRALGETGKVKSPTYGLMECYQLTADRATATGLQVLHLDLYRLQDPQELEYLGLRDLLDSTTLLLVEWPQHGAGVLPSADAVIKLVQTIDQRSAEIHPAALAAAVQMALQSRAEDS